MDERHDREQYFFDQATLGRLTKFLRNFERPCCLCTPLLGQTLVESGIEATILDVDDRFANVPGYVQFDLSRPHWLGKDFDLIICDPPFFNVSLSQLFKAVRMVAAHDFSQPLLLAYLRRRSAAIVDVFADFGLEPTDFVPTYQTVKEVERNDIEFFGNLGEEMTSKLRAG